MFIRFLLWFFLIVFIDAQLYMTSSSGCSQPRLPNGRSRMRQRAKLVKFVCYPRYELVGNKYATCRNGQWDVSIPVCVKPGCVLPQIQNGMMMSLRNDAWIMFFCLPSHRLVGSSVIYCDGEKWNSSAPTCVDSKAASPLSCDFEDPGLCGWTQDELHDFDWRRLNKKTPSSFLFTGPSYDHTYGKAGFGYYMYIESTSRLENDTARLISPIYDRDLSMNGCFSFFYHMYGQTTGGLRVYQKPDSLSLQDMLSAHKIKSKLLLFEKWGNLGDFWYSSVTMLSDLSDNFQIVIEGIRGKSFTSDIAIDDVAILQGDQCASAMREATTPSTMPDSCSDRCDVLKVPAAELGCGCTSACVADGNCCPDFFDVCIFAADSTTPEDLSPNNTDLAPQTQKLVASTVSTATSTTIRTTTPTTITAMARTTAASTTTTTRKPTKIPTLVFKSTTRVYNATGIIKKDLVNTTSTTQTTAKTSTTKRTTKPTYGISRTFENHNVYHEMVEKAKKEQSIERKTTETVRKSVHNAAHSMNVNEANTTDKSSGVRGGVRGGVIAAVVVALCACAVWAALVARGARGRAALARLRGRSSRDPEVRYLTTDVDE